MLTVDCDHVAFRLGIRLLVPENEIPVCRRHDHSCAVTLLKQPGAADVVAMPVAHQDVLDLTGFSPSFVRPFTTSSSTEYSKSGSVTMIPADVVMAHAVYSD